MIKELNLEKIWKLMNLLSLKEDELLEQGVYNICLLGNSSGYYAKSFEEFLEEYSFRINVDKIIIYNDDSIPYENDTRQDYSYIPIPLYFAGEEGVDSFVAERFKEALSEAEKEKIKRKAFLENQIKLLTNQLNNL